MYKSRIQKWGLDKKHKEHEARAIIHMHTLRLGKATRIRLRGQSVDINNVLSYFKRKGIAIEDVLSSEVATIQDLVCVTPVISLRTMPQRTLRADLHHLESPDRFLTAELLCTEIREYILASFGTGRWVSHGSDKYCQSKKALFAKGCPLDLFREVSNACSLFDHARPVQAVQTLSDGFASIKIIVADQSLGASPYLVRSVALLLVRRLKREVLSLCKQLCSMAAIVDSGGDRVTQFFKNIFLRIALLARNDEATDFLLTALQSLVDSYVEILGVCHLQTVQAVSTLTRVMNILCGPQSLVGPLTALYRSMEMQQGPGAWQSLLLLFELVDVHVDFRQFQASETALLEVIGQATLLMRWSKSRTTVSLLCYSHYRVPQVQAQQGKFSKAQISLHHAKILSQDVLGRNDWEIMSPRICLWELVSRTQDATELAAAVSISPK